ncbi:hypothetical protein BJV82DRAFT_593215 [Fennellomyces sp. T-0311]|nr:hypothetical protein BJV82DRAFT_593215 [Fennellomyces sp. T-0311]
MIIPTEPTPNLVIVKNVAPSTTEKMLTDFFSFCGKIDGFMLNNDTTALIMFDRASAAKTATLLNNATVNGNELAVEPYFSETPATEAKEDDEQAEPEAKPKSNVMAELLAAGYKLSDQILKAASDFDKKYGLWDRVEPYWKQLDNKCHVGDAANRAGATALQFEESADRWLRTNPMGQKIHSNLVEPIANVHAEAKRISNQQEANKDEKGRRSQ